MRDPNASDATLLLELEGLRTSPPIDASFRWAWQEFLHKGDAKGTITAAEQAAADEAIGRFSTFFETAGVLVRSGLLHEDVFFDRYMVGPFWDLAREATDLQRKLAGSAQVGENFEWLAKREPAVSARLEQRSRTKK